MTEEQEWLLPEQGSHLQAQLSAHFLAHIYTRFGSKMIAKYSGKSGERKAKHKLCNIALLSFLCDHWVTQWVGTPEM